MKLKKKNLVSYLQWVIYYPDSMPFSILFYPINLKKTGKKSQKNTNISQSEWKQNRSEKERTDG